MVLVLEFSEAFAKRLLRVSKIMMGLLLLLVVAFVATSSGELRRFTPDRPSCVNYSCKANEFKCTPCHGSCISVGRVCDGSKNCGDGSDEKGCDSCDDAHLVKCKSGNGCIANASICDGNRDCADGSDEKNCTTCAAHLFTCNGTYDERAKIRCIAKASICDGNRDCQDGSDERYCTPCRQFDKYRCFTVSQQCIPRAWICDGKKHCGDGSDENGCTCPYHRYKCKGFTAPSWWGNDPKIRCLGWDSLCDGRRDCRYGDDETDYACCKLITWFFIH